MGGLCQLMTDLYQNCVLQDKARGEGLPSALLTVVSVCAALYCTVVGYRIDVYPVCVPVCVYVSVFVRRWTSSPLLSLTTIFE